MPPTCTVPPGTTSTVGLSDLFELQFTFCTGSSEGLSVPAPKRLTYFKVDTDKNCPSLNSDDEDSEEFDPESYYASDS